MMMACGPLSATHVCYWFLDVRTPRQGQAHAFCPNAARLKPVSRWQWRRNSRAGGGWGRAPFRPGAVVVWQQQRFGTVAEAVADCDVVVAFHRWIGDVGNAELTVATSAIAGPAAAG